MKVLVATGSKYGATRDIGKAIATELLALGFEVEFEDACDVKSVTYYDAIVLGSAVYGGLWRRDASGLIKDHREELLDRDVWLFSVGMTSVTEPGQPLDEAEQLAIDVRAHEHQRFDGRLDPELLNFGEKALIRAIKPPVGDFRDFKAVKAWSQRVGADLMAIAADW
jgi:menaquinone-dependent protoporphyrinogen oxidase